MLKYTFIKHIVNGENEINFLHFYHETSQSDNRKRRLRGRKTTQADSSSTVARLRPDSGANRLITLQQLYKRKEDRLLDIRTKI